jgi:hypothetical protein
MGCEPPVLESVHAIRFPAQLRAGPFAFLE